MSQTSKYWEPKKNPKADLEKSRPLFFSIALFVTMLFVIFAFEWKSYDRPEDLKKLSQLNDFEELMDVPPTEILPPPPPNLQMPRIVEVPDLEEIKEEITVEFDMEVTNETVSQEFTVIATPKVEAEEVDIIFLVVEQTAAPRNGMAGFYKYVSDNIRYPAQARRMGIEGRVFVEFVVDREGKLGHFEILKGIGAGCDEEAIRIIQNSPPWSPGKQRGKPVRQRMVLPILFKLASSG